MWARRLSSSLSGQVDSPWLLVNQWTVLDCEWTSGLSLTVSEPIDFISEWTYRLFFHSELVSVLSWILRELEWSEEVHTWCQTLPLLFENSKDVNWNSKNRRSIPPTTIHLSLESGTITMLWHQPPSPFFHLKVSSVYLIQLYIHLMPNLATKPDFLTVSLSSTSRRILTSVAPTHPSFFLCKPHRKRSSSTLPPSGAKFLI